MLQDAIDPAALKRVLVIKLRHHGDVLLTSPVFTTSSVAPTGRAGCAGVRRHCADAARATRR